MNKQLSEKEKFESGLAALKRHKGLKEVYVTSDGTSFPSKNPATNHGRSLEDEKVLHVKQGAKAPAQEGKKGNGGDSNSTEKRLNGIKNDDLKQFLMDNEVDEKIVKDCAKKADFIREILANVAEDKTLEFLQSKGE